MEAREMDVSNEPVENFSGSAALLSPGLRGISQLSEGTRTPDFEVSPVTNIRLSVAKRVLDLVGAGLLLVLLFPVMLVIGLAVSADGGPILFAHQRLGRNGRPFKCLKFRSMVVRSDEALRELLARDPAAAQEWAETQKLRKDPRITRIGAFLRTTSLDELPQLLNVIVGDMSLVGPRPIVRDEARRYGTAVHYYYAVRPGLTGLWQTSGRSELSYEQRVQLDVAYVTGRTMLKDVKILFKTVRVVLDRAGAV